MTELASAVMRARAIVLARAVTRSCFFLLGALAASGAVVAQPAAGESRAASPPVESRQRWNPEQRARHWRALTPEERRQLREQLSPGERESLRNERLQRRRDRAERGEMPPHMMLSPEARRQMREQIREAQRQQREQMQRERMRDERRGPGN